MIGYLREIQVRRRMLVARANAERAALAVAVRPLARGVEIADRAATLARAALGTATAYAVVRRIARWASAAR